MGKDYITRHLISTSATATYAALNTGSDGSAPGSIKVPQHRNRISAVIATFGVDSTVGLDVGLIGVIKLSGKALPTGDQEFVVGALFSQEDGTSVGISVTTRRAIRIPTRIACTGGNEMTISGSYSGTDTGSQAFSVTLEFSTGGGSTANYYTRLDSMGQATATFNPVDTTAEGTTSTIVTEKSAKRITNIISAVTLNAAGVVTGASYTLKLSGTGMTEQEIVVGSTAYEAGGGTTTDTDILLAEPNLQHVDIDITGGNSLVLAAAYLGTDPGTPFIGITVEIE